MQLTQWERPSAADVSEPSRGLLGCTTHLAYPGNAVTPDVRGGGVSRRAAFNPSLRLINHGSDGIFERDVCDLEIWLQLSEIS